MKNPALRSALIVALLHGCFFVSASAVISTGFEGYADGNLMGQAVAEAGWSTDPWAGTESYGRFNIVDTTGDPLAYGNDNGASKAYSVGVPGGSTTLFTNRAFSPVISAAEVFFSYLIRIPDQSPAVGFPDFSSGGMWIYLMNSDNSMNGVWVGMNTLGAGDFRFFASVQKQTTTFEDRAVYTDMTLAIGQTYFVVGRLFKDQSATFYDAMDVWIDPNTMILGEPDLEARGSIANPHTGISSLGGVGFASTGFDASAYSLKTEFDNLRFSDSLAEVLSPVIIPEPSDVSFVVAALSLLLVRLRNRH